MTNYNERLEELMPCDCKFLKGFAWRKGDPCEGCINGRLKQAITSLIKELVAEAKQESHKSGYIQALADFSGYYMDASIPAQRNLIMPHIAIELTENYKYPQNLLKALEEVE